MKYDELERYARADSVILNRDFFAFNPTVEKLKVLSFMIDIKIEKLEELSSSLIVCA